jgi:hypothetical protein
MTQCDSRPQRFTSPEFFYLAESTKKYRAQRTSCNSQRRPKNRTIELE